MIVLIKYGELLKKFEHMKTKHYNSNQIVCGCDEAGRGALAGPVIASAVILPKNFIHKDLNDSKKISTKKRGQLSKIIKNKSLFWAIGSVNASEIDKINILNASIKAMHIAIGKIIKKMNTLPELLLIDGNRFKEFKNINYKCIIKGDAKYCSIAAASILAKTHRDQLMRELDKKYPQYNWKNNKGYPTQQHKQKILEIGPNKYHRKSFKTINSQYALQF